nr:DNA-directed DNA polymerase [Tanacetum cinerariifolium]
MNTRSFAKNLFPPLNNPKLTIRRRSHADPTLLNDFEMATEGNGDLPVPGLQTMKELCQPSLNGRVQNSCQFHGLPGDDANKHLDKFLHVTQSIKVNVVTDDALHLYLFPYSLTHHATAWFYHLLRNSINTFEQMAKMFLRKYFPPSMVTKRKNEITNFRQRPDESLFEAWERYKLSIDQYPNHNMLPVTQIDTFYNGLTLRHRDTINAAVGGGTFMKRRHEECYDLIKNMTTHHNDWDTSSQCTTVGQTQNVYAARAYQGNSYQPQGIKETIILRGTTKEGTNSSKELAMVKTRLQLIKPRVTKLRFINPDSSVFLKMNTTSSSSSGTLPVKRETKVTKDTVPPTNNGSTQDVQPLVVRTETSILNSEPVVAPIIEPVVAPLPEKLGDPDKFLIPCDLSGMDECLALADLGESINLMPLSVWNKLSLPELSPTCITLELTDRSISHPVGVTEDVFVKVGTFHFPTDFVVVDFDADPRVPLILERSFLKTGRALIDVFEGELTLRVGKEAITFNLDQSSRYSANYSDMTINRIDVIDMASETDKSSIDEPPKVELKDLPPHLEYEFLEGDDKWPIIIVKDLSDEEKTAIIMILKSYKRAIAWKLFDIKGINLEFCTHKILMEEDIEPAVQHQRKVNPKIHDVFNKEVLKLLDAGLIYPISDSPWVSPVRCVPKKGGFTVAENEENELILTRLVTGWRVCIDYRKLNEATRKDHFPLLFMDQMLNRLARNEYYCFLDGFSGYFQIPIDLKYQENTTFTCPYGMFAYRRMPFGLCNAPKKMLKQCEDTNLCLNWEKSHFMVKEGIILGHKISKNGIEVDKAKVDVIAKLPHPTTVKSIRSFLGHAGFYRRFIKDFSKIARPMTRLLEKDTSFFFFKKCVEAFQTLKRKLTEASILIAPDWDLPFELMCNASEFAIEISLCQIWNPRAIISARGTQFYNDQFAKDMLKYGVTHRLATVYHPQTSRQVEVSNRSLKRILERTVGENHASWSDKLDDALWAFHTAYKIPIGCTLYKLVYGKACHLPIKLEHKAYWALKHTNFDLQTTGDHIKVQLNELNDLHDQAYENSLIYKEKTKRLHDSKIKDRAFNVGDRVLLFNSRLKILSGKLKTCWSGLFTITHVFPYGTVELSQTDEPNFKVNGHRLKHYFVEDIPKMVVPDL